MAKVSFYFRVNLCTAHCCSMRCTRTHIYRCKIALLTPTSWDTLYAYKAQTHGSRGSCSWSCGLRLIGQTKRAQNVAKEQESTLKSDFATKFRAINRLFASVVRSFSPRWGSAYLALRQRRCRRRRRASSAAAPNTSLCSICFQYHFNNDAEHNNQIDVRRIVKTCTHTHTLTYTHIYLPSLLGICQVIQSGCELTRVYYFSLYILLALGIWIHEYLKVLCSEWKWISLLSESRIVISIICLCMWCKMETVISADRFRFEILYDLPLSEAKFARHIGYWH